MAVTSRWLKYSCITGLFLLIWASRCFHWSGPFKWWISLGRSCIYTGIFLFWGFSLYSRIMQEHVRRYLIAVSALMVFWMVIRTIKFLFVSSPSIGRLLWYLYYIPEIFIPLMTVMATFFLGKPASWKKPQWTRLLYIPAGCLLMFVLSNDHHQLVFSFLYNINQFSNGQYHHEAGYYLVLGWIVCCVVMGLILLFASCRLVQTGRRIWIPLLPLYGLLGYDLTYLLFWPILRYISLDLTVVNCIFIILIFECCFSCGLIQTNTHYMELFRQLKAPAALLNETGKVELSSNTMSSSLAAALSADPSIFLEQGLVIRRMPIHGGSIAWVEDIAVLEDLKSELEEKARQLSVKKARLEAEVILKEKKAAAETRTRLYDRASREMKVPFARLERLGQSLSQYPDNQKQILAYMCVSGVYIKRRCNMLILQEEEEQLSLDVLYHALRESCDYIQLCNIDCHIQFKGNREVSVEAMKEIYDRFQRVVDACLFHLKGLLVIVVLRNDQLLLKMQAEVSSNVILQDETLLLEQEDGLVSIRTSVPLYPDRKMVLNEGEAV